MVCFRYISVNTLHKGDDDDDDDDELLITVVQTKSYSVYISVKHDTGVPTAIYTCKSRIKNTLT
jgi:hypothetical protein